MKPKIHFHTDCSFFAGCENMLSVLFNNKEFKEEFDLSFSYNYNKEYEEGCKQRINEVVRTYPIELSKNSSEYNGGLVRILHKIVRPAYLVIDTYKIYRVLKKEKPDILHINNGGYPGALSCSLAVLSAKIAGVKKIVYVVNNIPTPINSIQRTFLYPLDLIVKFGVSRFVTGSACAGEALINVLRLNKNKVIQIPNTIVPRKITKNKTEFRKQYGVDEEDVLIGCVGIFEERKGHKYLIKAFSKVLEKVKKHRKIFLIIDGHGKKENEIKEQIEFLRLRDYIILTNLENIYDLYNAMDFLVVPSIEKEDFPNVIIEAMYNGKAVVGTEVGGIPEQIDTGYTGKVVKPKDVTELEQTIEKIAENKILMNRYGVNGKIKFEQKYSEKIIIEKYLRFYNEL